MGFLSPTLTIQLRQRIPETATWTDCLNELDKIMEIRHPKVWRRLEAFTIEPTETERNEYSKFVARQKQKWTQVDVAGMSIKEMMMIHIVRMIPDRNSKRNVLRS